MLEKVKNKIYKFLNGNNIIYRNLESLNNEELDPSILAQNINPKLEDGFSFGLEHLLASLFAFNPKLHLKTTYNYDKFVKHDYEWMCRAILNIADLDRFRKDINNTMNLQDARITGNNAYKDIAKDIETHGYKLHLEPISLRVGIKSDGTVFLDEQEGRHRLALHIEKGVTNVIVDIFYVEDDSDANRISMHLNTSKNPHGSLKKADFLALMWKLVKNRSIDGLNSDLLNSNKNDDWQEYRKKAAALLKNELASWSNGKVPPTWEKSIINTILDNYTKNKNSHYRRFENGESDVRKIMEDFGYVDSVGTVKYIYITPDNPSMFLSTINTIKNNGLYGKYDPNTEYRIMPYCKETAATDPQLDWINRTQGKANEFLTKHIKSVNGSLPSNIKIYGAVEQVRTDGMTDEEWNSIRLFDEEGIFIS